MAMNWGRAKTVGTFKSEAIILRASGVMESDQVRERRCQEKMPRKDA